LIIVNEAALNQMVYSYFQSENGFVKPSKFNPDNAESFFQSKYTGGPDAIKYAPKEGKGSEKPSFLKLSAFHNAAKII